MSIDANSGMECALHGVKFEPSTGSASGYFCPKCAESVEAYPHQESAKAYAMQAVEKLSAERDALNDKLGMWFKVLEKTQAERDRLLKMKEDYEILVDECVKYREALKQITLILGPTIPDCCEGAQAEMEGALEIARAALGEKPE